MKQKATMVIWVVLLGLSLPFVYSRFLCYGGKLIPMDALTPCPDGWNYLESEHGNRCFRLFMDLKTQKLAENDCKRYGGHLASFHSQDELDQMMQDSAATAKDQGKSLHYVWLGGKWDNAKQQYSFYDKTDYDFKEAKSLASWPPSAAWTAVASDGTSIFWYPPSSQYNYICQTTVGLMD